jgi:hypothetical protein
MFIFYNTVFKKFLVFAYLEFIFVDVPVFTFSRVNYGDVCATFWRIVF